MNKLISLRLPAALLERLDTESKTQRRSRGFLVRDALDTHLPQATASKNGATKKATAKKAVKKVGAR